MNEVGDVMDTCMNFVSWSLNIRYQIWVGKVWKFNFLISFFFFFLKLNNICKSITIDYHCHHHYHRGLGKTHWGRWTLSYSNKLSQFLLVFYFFLYWQSRGFTFFTLLPLMRMKIYLGSSIIFESWRFLNTWQNFQE